MHRSASPLSLAILLPGLLCACLLSAQDPAPKPPRYAAEMAAFREEDRVSPPPAGVHLFVGSSSFRLWKTLATDLTGYPVRNRGFGGSTFPDVLDHFDTLFTAPDPAFIFLYEGDNDLNSGRSPASVLADAQAVIARLRQKYPAVPIAFVSPKPCPARWAKSETYLEFHRLLATWCASQPGLHFIDVWTPMLSPDGSLSPSLFVADQVHLNPAGYAIWTRVLREFLAAPH